MKKNILTFTVVAFAAIGWQNCTTDNNIPTVAVERKLALPTKDYDYQAGAMSFAREVGGITNNAIDSFGNKRSFNSIGFGFNPTQINNGVATLGRVLFYDTKMSINNTIACGSCHLQSKSFSDPTDLSSGFKGVKTTRNSMSIANPILTNNLFWDSRSKSLEDMVLKPVQNHIEMGMENLDFLATKLNNTSYYPNLFKKAFTTEGVTKERINTALMTFLASMVTHNSKFDEGSKTNFKSFSSLELVGKDLFMSERLSCTKCHTGANFSLGDELSSDNPYGGGSVGTNSSNGTANIGLNMVYKDNGSGNGKFKIPSLRNIELTGPYMHDGRFKTLEEVIEHYNSGIQAHPHLDSNLKNAKGEPRQLNLTALEKNALMAFLKTLTDPVYTTDVKYSDPFTN